VPRSKTPPIFIPIFQALSAAGVDHIIVGGMGVVLHGHVRLTEDLDIVVDPSHLHNAEQALVELGLRPQRTKTETDRLSLVDPDTRRFVDLFTDLPISFSAMHAEGLSVALADTITRVVSIAHLIALKRLTAQPMDRVDIDDLETILREVSRPAPEGPKSQDDWGDLSHEGARLTLLRTTMGWSPAERVRRVEDLIDLAYQAGALPRRDRPVLDAPPRPPLS
jgi:hypothetical protein